LSAAPPRTPQRGHGIGAARLRPSANLAATPRPRPVRVPRPRPLAAVPRRQPELPPSIVLTPRPRPADPRDLASVREPEMPPPTPIAVARTPPELPAGPPTVFNERPTRQEQPQIRIVDASGLAGALVLLQGGVPRRWNWPGRGMAVNEAIPAGEYAYEIYGPSGLDPRTGEIVGEPDLAGTVRCRKYRLYELTLVLRRPWEPQGTIHKDWGDDAEGP
jgi:hypothetical protein